MNEVEYLEPGMDVKKYRYIYWKQTDKQKWVGYDQWQEKWEVDGWLLRKGVILTKYTNDNIEMIEYFDDIETAKEVAEFINAKRGNWDAR